MANTSGNEIPLEETRLTDRLVTLVADTKFEDLPPATLVSAKQLILDTIGVSLTASTHEVGKIISQYALDMTGKPHWPTAPWRTP
jgi:2-methylcitrate dehydratase PrpD